MARVFVPTMLQATTGGVKEVEVAARNVRQVIEQLDERFPGIANRLMEDGEIRSNPGGGGGRRSRAHGPDGAGRRKRRDTLRTRHRRRLGAGRRAIQPAGFRKLSEAGCTGLIGFTGLDG